MAYSYVKYKGNGVTTDFAFPHPYLDKLNILVMVNTNAVPFTWVNDTTLSITPAPAADAEVIIARDTNKTSRIVDFNDNSVLTERDLDLSANQVFYIAQEVADLTTDNAAQVAKLAAEAQAYATAAYLSERSAYSSMEDASDYRDQAKIYKDTAGVFMGEAKVAAEHVLAQTAAAIAAGEAAVVAAEAAVAAEASTVDFQENLSVLATTLAAGASATAVYDPALTKFTFGLPQGAQGPKGDPGTSGTGTGDVNGPAVSVNNRVAFFDGTTGKMIKDSGLTLAGSNTGDQDLSGYATTAAVAAGYQPLDSDLTAIAGITTAPYGRSLLALNDSTAGRTSLGLGSLATQSGTFSGVSSGTNTGDQTEVTGNAGTATVLATPRSIYGNSFDGSANLAQIITSPFGGTGSGFTKFSGPAVSEKTFTLPNASANILTSAAAVTVAQGGTGLATLTANNVILGAGTGTPTFVAPGTSGNVLTSNGTTWTSATVSGGGALVLLATLTPTAAATVDALSAFTSTYDNYLILIGGGVRPTADDSLCIRFGVAGAADTTSSYYRSAFGTASSTAAAQFLNTAVTTFTGLGVALAVTVQNANSTGATSKIVSVTGVTQSSSTPAHTPVGWGGAFTSTSAITGIRLYWNAGSNFSAVGKIRIYGYNNT